MNSNSLSLRVILAYISVCIIWGSTYLAIRVGVEYLPPALFAGLRFFFAGGAMLLFGKIKRSPMPARSDISHLSIVGIFLLVGGNLLVVWSEKTIPSGLAALIIAVVPLFMSTIDSFTPKGQSLTWLGWIGILIGFAGVFILVSPSIGLAEGQNLDPLGIAGLIAASCLWSIGSVYSKHHHVEGDVFVNSGVQNLVPGIILLVLGVTTGELNNIHFTPESVLALLYLIVMGSIIGYTSYVYLLRHMAPAKASTYAYVNPVVAILLGWVLLGEQIDLRTIIATLVILGGVAIVQTSRMKTT